MTQRISMTALVVCLGTLAGTGAAQAAIKQLPHYRAFLIKPPDPQANVGKGTLSNPDPFASGFGERLRTTGDTNGDGVKDVLIADVNYNAPGNPGQGRLYVMDPVSRRVLRTIDDPTPQANARFGFWSAALGKTGEFVVSADAQNVGANSSQGQVFIFDGKTGALRLTINDPDPQPKADFGGNVISPGDLNGDGFPDIVVTASRAQGGAGIAYAFDGRSGRLLYRVSNPDMTQLSGFGFGAAELGDVNGDGVGDYQIGAPFYNDQGLTRVGRSYVFSGKTGQLIFTLANPDPTANARFGQADADGIAPGPVGGSGAAPGIYVDGFLSNDGALETAGLGYLFSGQNGHLITRLHDPTPLSGGQFGVADAPAGNLNKDGLPGLAVGEDPHHDPTAASDQSDVTVFVGPNLSKVLTIFKDPMAQANSDFGNSIAMPGDINHDSFPDFLVGARSADLQGLPNTGAVWEFVSQDTTSPGALRVSGPRGRSRRTVTYRFSSSDPDNLSSELRFRCSIDSRRLHRCGPRLTARLRRGRHFLRVQVTDPAGNSSSVRVIVIHRR